MNAGSSINAQREDLSLAKGPSLRALPDRKPLQLVKTQGQLQYTPLLLEVVFLLF